VYCSFVVAEVMRVGTGVGRIALAIYPMLSIGCADDADQFNILGNTPVVYKENVELIRIIRITL